MFTVYSEFFAFVPESVDATLKVDKQLALVGYEEVGFGRGYDSLFVQRATILCTNPNYRFPLEQLGWSYT
jgi:hypothetical protein